MKRKRKLKEVHESEKNLKSVSDPSKSLAISEQEQSDKMPKKNKRKKKGLSKGDISRSSVKPSKNSEIHNPYEPCDVSILKNFGDIKTKDIQTLALNYLGCTQAVPDWCLVTNRGAGNKVCIVMVEALYPFIYKTMATQMPNFSSLFHNGPTEIQNPGSELFVTPAGSAILEKEPKKRANDSSSRNGKDGSGISAFPPVQDYILKQDYMLAHEYPSLETLNKEPGWRRFTGNISVQASSYPLYAIDCEMCITAVGSEVTQIAIVDETLNCIYKSYIKPANPIIDYVTAYSGITAEILKDVTTTLAQVIKHVNDILPPQAVFVGHSLENDLRCLKLFHDKVIDTSTLFSSSKGGSLKPGLRFLAMRFLKAKIQDGSNGHDPAEDAMTCMRLVRLKVKKGPNFGINKNHHDENSLSIYLTKQSKTGVFVDKPIVAQQHCHGLAQALPASSDEAALDTFTRRLSTRSEFFWLHLYKLEPIYRACTTIHDMINNPELIPALKFIDESIKNIYTALPADTLFVIFSGCSGYWKKPEFNGSDEAMKKLMINIVAQVRRGLMFIKVKN